MLWAKRSQTDGGAIDREDDFKYDVFGNRTEKSYDSDGAGASPATVTRFAYDAWKNTNQHLVGNENSDVWADLDGSSVLTTRYLRGDVIDHNVLSEIDRAPAVSRAVRTMGCLLIPCAAVGSVSAR